MLPEIPGAGRTEYTVAHSQVVQADHAAASLRPRPASRAGAIQGHHRGAGCCADEVGYGLSGAVGISNSLGRSGTVNSEGVERIAARNCRGISTGTLNSDVIISLPPACKRVPCCS